MVFIYITILHARNLSWAQLWDISTPPGGGEVPWWFWAVIRLVYSTQDSFTHMSGIQTGMARRRGSAGLPFLHGAAEPPMGSPRRWARLFTGSSGLPEQVFLETEVKTASYVSSQMFQVLTSAVFYQERDTLRPNLSRWGRASEYVSHSQVLPPLEEPVKEEKLHTRDLWSDQMHWADFCSSIIQLISVSLLSWCLPESFVHEC